jgi:glycerate dehydrogenase
MKRVLISAELDEKLKIEGRRYLEGVAEVYFMDEIDESIIPKIEILVVLEWEDVIGDEILENMLDLKFIQCMTAGVDHIPFEKLKENILVAKGSDPNAPYIAEHVFALMLAASKRLFFHDREMREGRFRQDVKSKALLKKNLGLIGLGAIGREVVKRAKAFGMKVYGISKRGKSSLDIEFIGKREDLPKILRISDYLVIACPLTRETRGMIGKRELTLMKRDAILVNVSRGKIIDEKALYYHLKENRDFIACLDVWWNYPDGSYRGQNYPFEELPNLIMTPHIASLVPGYFKNMYLSALENVKKYIKGTPEGVVQREDYL